MRTKTRTTRKRTGSLRRVTILVSILLSAIAACTAIAGEKPREKKEKQKNPAPMAMVTGTVFSSAGFALAGPEVIARPDPPEGKKQWKVTGNARGEYFLRLPAGPASYTVVVRANGFKPQEKKVTFGADERLDFNFLLEPGGEGVK